MAVVSSGVSSSVRRIAGSPVFGSLELLALLAAMAYVDHAGWFAFKLTHLQPHPYWLPVVLAAACYGRSPGLFIAIVATGLDWTLGQSALASYADLYEFVVAISRDAILWLAAAIVLGGIHERHADRLKETNATMGQREVEARILAERCRALIQEVSVRDRLIAASDASVAESMLEMLEGLMSASGAATLENYEQTLKMLIGASDISVYVPTHFGWDRLSTTHQPAASTVPPSVCDAIALSERVLSCHRWEDARVLDGHAAVAACVRRQDGRVAGVIFLGQVEPDCMTSAGEAAIKLASFILCNRYLEPLPLEHLRTRQDRPQLRLVNCERREAECG